MPHTQTSIVVYMTYTEKSKIINFANICNKSMSRYLLDIGILYNPSMMVISVNNYMNLYAAVHAAFDRLKKIQVSKDKTCHAVEKEQVLSLLADAKKFIDSYTNSIRK